MSEKSRLNAATATVTSCGSEIDETVIFPIEFILRLLISGEQGCSSSEKNGKHRQAVARPDVKYLTILPQAGR